VHSCQSGLFGRKNLWEGNKVVCQVEKNCRRPTKWFVWQKKVVASRQSGL
jgi:hypothetical protein